MDNKRKVHPNALHAEVEQLFSEIIKVETLPTDFEKEIQLDGKKVYVKNETKYINFLARQDGHLFIQRKIDRRDKEQLHRIIVEDLENYVSSHKDRDKSLFRSRQLKKIENFQQVLCPDYENDMFMDQLKLFNDLEAYKEALLEVIPDEQTAKVETEKEDRRQSKSKPKNDVRLKALMDILPEFVDRVRKVKSTTDKGKLIELITGVNPTEAYQKIYTEKSLNIKQEEQDRIDRFKAMIEQSEPEN